MEIRSITVRSNTANNSETSMIDFCKKKGEVTHGITLIRDLFHHLPELHPKIHNEVWYFICTSPMIDLNDKLLSQMLSFSTQDTIQTSKILVKIGICGRPLFATNPSPLRPHVSAFEKLLSPQVRTSFIDGPKMFVKPVKRAICARSSKFRQDVV